MDGRVIPTHQRIRLIKDPPLPGTWNMAVDESLLLSATEDIATLRFYRWNEATVSLGYFQQNRARRDHHESLACPLVRRSSGGGAIVHHHELTYSFSCKAEMIDTQWLYDAMHESLRRLLGDEGIETESCSADISRSIAPLPFLCFLRRSPGDVLCGPAKIAGSAQRRRRGAVLQHGSVVLADSPFAPQLSSIYGQTGVQIEGDQLADDWARRLSKEWQVDFVNTELEGHEIETAQQLEREKFANESWVVRR